MSKITYTPEDPRDEPGDNFKFVKKQLTDPKIIAARLEAIAPYRTVHVEADPVQHLVEVLGLEPKAVSLLKGATRLNFWNNGRLNVQIEHGTSSWKLTCASAVEFDNLKRLFVDAWGWTQVSGKPYFRPGKEAVVRL